MRTHAGLLPGFPTNQFNMQIALYLVIGIVVVVTSGVIGYFAGLREFKKHTKNMLSVNPNMFVSEFLEIWE